mmetsp:Transcript_43400/g.136028  ORF Transcript_43400/g.136028 Transcript_43400/m.136028 type:complete len:234 (-) Transcript_43400:911-1612(-)
MAIRSCAPLLPSARRRTVTTSIAGSLHQNASCSGVRPKSSQMNTDAPYLIKSLILSTCVSPRRDSLCRSVSPNREHAFGDLPAFSSASRSSMGPSVAAIAIRMSKASMSASVCFLARSDCGRKIGTHSRPLDFMSRKMRCSTRSDGAWDRVLVEPRRGRNDLPDEDAEVFASSVVIFPSMFSMECLRLRLDAKHAATPALSRFFGCVFVAAAWTSRFTTGRLDTPMPRPLIFE